MTTGGTLHVVGGARAYEWCLTTRLAVSNSI